MSDKSDTEVPAKKKGKLGKMLVMGVALLALIGSGVGAGLYAARSGMVGGGGEKAKPVVEGPKLVPKNEQKRSAGGGESAPAKGNAPPSGEGGDRYASNYFAMEKDFTANLQNSPRFVQVGVAVSTPYDDTVIQNLKTNDIAVRSAILMTLGDTSEEQVYTTEGKHRLQVRLVHAINDVLKQKEGFGGVSNVYFTNFVVQ
ncbi:flagellar basal body-associated FliL family protein [Sphingomonas bacterium]|uniref:flagellar basal body-associated FliL family protein n=1 Tax=Sphingomonas bacterium TaxID=1895847 RepID=UPI0015750A2B|nr:flagellar basal body-associated FliL family protein [Sphingomonas bacterium]